MTHYVLTGKFLSRYENGGIKMEYNLLSRYFYGKCVYYGIDGNKKIETEYSKNFSSRTKQYDENGNIMYVMVERIGKYKHIKKYIDISDDLCVPYVPYKDFLTNYELCAGDELISEKLDVAIFHYNDNKISYREKDDKVIKYYKNGYMQKKYKNKKFFFY